MRGYDGGGEGPHLTRHHPIHAWDASDVKAADALLREGLGEAVERALELLRERGIKFG